MIAIFLTEREVHLSQKKDNFDNVYHILNFALIK